MLDDRRIALARARAPRRELEQSAAWIAIVDGLSHGVIATQTPISEEAAWAEFETHNPSIARFRVRLEPGA